MTMRKAGLGAGRGWRWMPLWFWLLLAGLALPAGATPAAPEESLDYDAVEPPGVHRVVDGPVEVVEFFWYQCPHCNALMPLIEPWARQQGERVRFVRLPLALNPAYAQQDWLYYALDEIGVLERLHASVFQAIHDDRVDLKTVAQMAEFLLDEGVPRARFEEAMASSRVGARVARARDLASHYKIAEVPTLVVDGRYLTSASRIGGSQADVVAVIEWLVRRVEDERRSAHGQARPGGTE